ncbi:hypothetical protein C8J56DRAFT_1161084 [Mycena floridula]|nr:hypothetical protein C8J56DRAFT_1161084 [Mycena floridula]
MPARAAQTNPDLQPYRRPSLSKTNRQNGDLPAPPQSSPARLSPQFNHSQGGGLYSVNTLNSYSFGAAQSQPSSRSVDPLEEDDETRINIDVTPRPSVVGYDNGIFGAQRTAWAPGGREPSIFNPDPSRTRSSDTASHRTFGSSSASASVTSLSSVGRHDSRNSGRSSSTRHTSAANTDDESRSDADERRNLELSSDDEYEDDDYYDEDEDPAYHVEISSAVYDENANDAPADPWASFGSRPDLPYGRRGSLPMAIPGAEARMGDQVGYGRDESLLNLRRPSRSLDDDLAALNLHSGAASDVARSPPGSIDPLAHSVPGTDSDWKQIASKQRLSQGRGSISTVSTIRDGRYSNIISNSSRVNAPPPTDGFDPDWLDILRGGITSVPTSDFVHSPEPGGKSSMFGLRRPSAASVMTYDDSFLKAVGGWDQAGYGVQRREWTFKREMADGNGPYHHKPHTGAKLAGLLGSRTAVVGDRVGLSSISSNRSVAISAVSVEERERRERGKERLPENWKGMTIGAGEVWCNMLIGRYEVNRTTSTPSDPTKGPQQRLGIIHFSDDFTKLKHKSPPVTVHKHSKAIAYSISRFYRLRVHAPPEERTANSFTRSSSREGRPTTGTSENSAAKSNYTRPKGSSTMILLAPRRVQEDYTNTTTTRKLESHGLLDEQVRAKEKVAQSRDREKEKEKRQKSEDPKKAQKKAQKEAAKLEREQMSSSGSVASTSSSHFAPPPATLFASDHAERHRSRRRPRSIASSSDEDLPHRTPHSETYSTVDPGVLDQLRPSLNSYAAGKDSGLFKRMLQGGRGSRTTTAAGASNYNPPWMVMSSRNEQEKQQKIVKNLSSSFAGVGLLPPTQKERNRSDSRKTKSQDRSAAVDIFDEIGPDTLFMILPLWPGETDPKSRNKPFERPDIPQQHRLFLIVSYRATAKRPSGSESKKTRSPTSSGDAREDRNVLLSAFSIGARIVRYPELIGSGMRVPDEGIAVSGPLAEAYHNLPNPDSGMQLIGNCPSRESGIEFDPEGLVCLGLCNFIPSNEYSSPDGRGIPIPTPIGRAVMEMAWIGGMALTSFGAISA